MRSIAPGLPLVFAAFFAVAANSVAALERALLIEPRNPTVWHYLGLARFDQGNYSQAEAMAAKSHNLASADRSLRTRNAGLMASAQQAAGKHVSVPGNEPPVSALRRLFAAEVEPARTYADSGYADSDDQPERSDGVQRRWPSADAVTQTGRTVQSRNWRRLDDGYAERVRERARQSERSRSVIVFDGQRYRRYGLNEGNRRRRYWRSRPAAICLS